MTSRLKWHAQSEVPWHVQCIKTLYHSYGEVFPNRQVLKYIDSSLWAKKLREQPLSKAICLVRAMKVKRTLMLIKKTCQVKMMIQRKTRTRMTNWLKLNAAVEMGRFVFKNRCS